MELALDTQPLLSWLRKGELWSSGELEGFGGCENKFLCSEVPPQVRSARGKNGSLPASGGVWEATGFSTGSSWNGAQPARAAWPAQHTGLRKESVMCRHRHRLG